MDLFEQIVANAYQKVHAIDRDTFEVLYANRASIEGAINGSEPYEGRKCHEYFFGNENQCEKCPLKNESIDDNFVTEKDNGAVKEMVHTEVFEWNGRRVYAEYVEDVTKYEDMLSVQESNMEIISALSENYLNVFQINPLESTVKIVKLDGYVTDGFDKTKNVSYDYDTMLKRYLEGRVLDDDKEYMDKAISLQKVLEELSTKKSYIGKYRVLEDGKIHYYQYKFTTTHRDNIIIAGFSNIDEIIEKEMEYNASLEKKNAELIEVNSERDRQIEILRAISDIYYSMHYIDLKSNTTIEYSADAKLRPYVHGQADASGQITLAMKHRCSNEHMDSIMEFINLHTVADRMKEKQIISLDFLNIDNIWIRASFIKVDVDSQGYAQSVIFTTQVVDEEKRREENLIINSYTDVLTKLFNRRAFERTIEKYRTEEMPDNLYVIEFDVNGLKHVNDTMGHAAGDELILGATSCFNSSFGSYGTLYRVGGDEFIGVVMAREKEIVEIVKDFELNISKWHGDRLDSVSVSFAYVSAKENPGKSFEELADMADLKMYEAKRKFYQNK